jgi:hypothetical protein
MKVKKRKARCKQVLAVLCNKLETLECLREVIYPPFGDFADSPLECMVCRYKGAGSYDEIEIPMSCVIFLK